MKYFFSLLLFACSSLQLQAQYFCDTIYSGYKDGEFFTYADVEVNAPKEVCMEMVADLIDQFRGNPDELFTWAFKGIGKQEGEDNAKNDVLLILKEALYDKVTQIGTLVFDIKVPNLRTYEDVRIESKVSQYEVDNVTDGVGVDVFYSNSLLKKTYGTFLVQDIGVGRSKLTIHIHVRFGWFFNIFITQRRYRNLIEWRTDGFMNNLRLEAERRAAI